MLNRVELIGNLTREPELQYSPSGTPYCYLRVATNRRSGGVEHSDFHFVIAWHALAERSAEYLHTGDRTYIEGRLETNSYADKGGSNVERSRVVANRVLFLERRRDRPAPRVPEPSPSAEAVQIANVIASGRSDAHEQRGPAEESP
jgi:single-strand DNA-binding protein